MDDLVAGTQLRNHIETLDRGTKDGVTGIEVMLGAQAEVELRTRGIGVHGACHGKGAIDMAVARIGGKLALDAVAGATGTGHAVGALKTGSDVGITGQDLLKNSGTAALEHMPLGFGASTFRFAAPNESPITTLEDVQGKRVATTFDKLVHDYLVEHGIQAETIHLDGAVESSVQLGVADLIADVVSTGTTLRNAGLRVFAEPLMHSEACLIRSPRLNEQDSRLAVLTRRLQGVLTAHQYVLMDYDIPISKVAAAVAVTPGFESPTISPLHDKQWNAVRVMVPKAKVNQLMDDLYEVGARGIIVTALQASRM